MANPVAVIGAGGTTGRECVKQLIEKKTPVKAIVRNPSKYAETFPKDPLCEVVAGDVTDTNSLGALKGCDGVIFAASGTTFFGAHAVDNKGVANVAQAAKAAGCKHMVLVSSQLVSKKHRFHPVRVLLNNVRWSLMDHKLAGEDALRSSGLPYTVVRPPGLTNGPGHQTKLLAGQGDKGLGGVRSISRADVAAVCVEAVSNPAARNVTLEIGDSGQQVGPKEYVASIQSLFHGLKPNFF